ncbi:unnamed protein product [Discosporangium mesarthrocarpum]
MATIRATFVDHLVPVPGMADVYRRWAQEAAAVATTGEEEGGGEGGLGRTPAASLSFDYVSGSPWFLAKELEAWLGDADKEGGAHPAGSFWLKRFRVEVLEPWGLDSSLVQLTGSNFNMKMAHINGVFERHRDKAFILVGDSSEQDPEVYGALARERGDQVVCILIREVPRHPWSPQREAEAFRGIPPEKRAVFTSPKQELQGVKVDRILRARANTADVGCGLVDPAA